MIIVIAKVIPKENKETDLIRIASDLVDVTRNEEKNISYDFFLKCPLRKIYNDITMD